MRTHVGLRRVFFPRSRSSLEPARSFVSDSVTPGTITRQAPLSIRFSRQEYWSGLSFPSPGDLPCPGIEPVSPTLQMDSLLPELPGKSITMYNRDTSSRFRYSRDSKGQTQNSPI